MILDLTKVRPIFVAAAVLAAATVGRAEAAPLATTTAGAVRGALEGDVAAYRGVPYARPPVGDRRWRAPAKLAPWSGVRLADRFSASCFQIEPGLFGPYTAEFIAKPPFSEDCLYLNVWSPANPKPAAPVLVWFHGGGFGGGSGAVPIYDGAHLAAKGVVVVTVNYRLGVLGFLAHPELSAESPDHVSGNYGLLDMIAALEWVRDNIRQFGGDPAQVTIAGESAGAMAVNDLMMAPRAKDLFQRAVSMSGPAMGFPLDPMGEAEKQGLDLAREADVPGLSGLRALSPQKLAELTNHPPDLNASGPRAPSYVPNLDGVVIAADPESGAPPISPAPLLAGFNADEAILPKGGTVTPAEFAAFVREHYGDAAERLLPLYPHDDAESASRSLREIGRDRYMANFVLWAEQRARVSDQPVYPYLFDHAYPVPNSATWRSFHTAAVPYLFGTLNTPGRPFTDRDRAVAQQVQAYLLGFMGSGTPVASGFHEWVRFDARRTEVMGLGDTPETRPAVSSPERLQALRDYVARGGRLSLF